MERENTIGPQMDACGTPLRDPKEKMYGRQTKSIKDSPGDTLTSE